MNRREVFWLVGGLVVGAIIGFAIASLAGVFPPLSGTAANAPTTTYYLAKVTDVSEWLAEQYGESDDLNNRLSSTVETVGELSTQFDIQEDFKSVRSEVDVLLAGVHGALIGDKATLEEINALAASASEDTEITGPQGDQISVCLALDDDPYSMEGPTMYLYVTVPESQLDMLEADIPESWEESTEPKSTDLFWLLLSCYVQEES